MSWGYFKAKIKKKLEEKFEEICEGDHDDTGHPIVDKIVEKIKDHCPCFTRGTLIDTPTGPVAVETLEAGDLILTKDHGPQPLRWVGSIALDEARLAASPAMRPIRIKAGALGDGLPKRDLVVSPAHAMLLNDWRAALVADETEVLAPAEMLINDQTIRPDAAESVEYFHLLFDAHEIIFAEGAATESYRPCGENHEAFDATRQAELLVLFPELAEDASAYGAAARPILRAKDWSAMQRLA